jgi:BirA family biotin operon repressor/biotin-[acetyl-CoA-carboxylase] ligase
MRLIPLEEVDSTNEYLKRQIRNGLKILPIAVSTLYQTAGKGRQGKIWQSLKGENVLMSIACHYKYDYVTLNKFSAIILANSLKNLFPHLDFKIKWPNDIILRGKKVAGILTEKVKSTYIVGIGINTNQTNFGNLKYAISIKKLTGQHVDNIKVIMKIISQFENFSKMLSKSAIHMLYEESLWGFNKTVTIETQNLRLTGMIKEVNYYGALVIKTRTGKILTFPENKASIPYEFINSTFGNF